MYVTGSVSIYQVKMLTPGLSSCKTETPSSKLVKMVSTPCQARLSKVFIFDLDSTGFIVWFLFGDDG